MTDKMTTVQPTAIAPAAPDLNELMAAAIQQGEGGVAALERLVDLQERVMRQQADATGRRALAQAKSEFPEIVKTYGGPHSAKKVTADGRRYTAGNYAPLSDISAAVDPILTRHGFTYDWDREVIDGKGYIVCILTHVDGYEKRSKFPDLVDEGRGRSQIQSIASGESYGKRYSLVAVLGLTTVDPDDDGQSSGRKADEGPAISEHEAANIAAALEEVGADVPVFCKWFGVATIDEIPESRKQQAWAGIERKRKGGGK